MVPGPLADFHLILSDMKVTACRGQCGPSLSSRQIEGAELQSSGERKGATVMGLWGGGGGHKHCEPSRAVRWKRSAFLVTLFSLHVCTYGEW